MTFDQMIKNLAMYVRYELQPIETISSLDFNVSIEGRVHDGEFKIEYELGSTYSNGGQVKGGNLMEVVNEYKRRHGWDRRNAPLMLSHDGTVITEE